MDRITDFEKFKEFCTKYNKAELKMLLDYWAFQRILHELVLVKAINNCKENGDPITDAENIADLDNIVQGERILIGLLGRKEAAKVYGMMEGITSDVETVDWVLTEDFVKYYTELTNREKVSKEQKE